MVGHFLKTHMGNWGVFLVALKFLILFVLMSVSVAVATEKELKHPIDIQLEYCINLNHTTVGMNTCVVEAMSMWDKEMNKVYKELISTLSVKQKVALKKSQVVWLKYRNEESVFLDNFYGDFQGMMWINILSGDKLNLLKQRTLMLQGYFQNLKETK